MTEGHRLIYASDTVQIVACDRGLHVIGKAGNVVVIPAAEVAAVGSAAWVEGVGASLRAAGAAIRQSIEEALIPVQAEAWLRERDPDR